MSVSIEQPGPHFHRGVRQVNKYREVSTRQVLITGDIGSWSAKNQQAFYFVVSSCRACDGDGSNIESKYVRPSQG